MCVSQCVAVLSHNGVTQCAGCTCDRQEALQTKLCAQLCHAVQRKGVVGVCVRHKTVSVEGLFCACLLLGRSLFEQVPAYVVVGRGCQHSGCAEPVQKEALTYGDCI
jgi:hypothetical protein